MILEDNGSCCCEQGGLDEGAPGRELIWGYFRNPGLQGHGLEQGSGNGMEGADLQYVMEDKYLLFLEPNTGLGTGIPCGRGTAVGMERDN